MTSQTSAVLPASPVKSGVIARTISRRFSNRLVVRQHRHYAKWKLLTDPLYQAVLEEVRVSDLPLLDVGCGMGLLAFYLREQGVNIPVYGLDFDAAKIASAIEVSSQYNPQPSFHVGDMRTPWPDVRGHVCLLDVLQYLTVEGRANLLAQAIDHVAPGGKLIIRGSIKEDTWRCKVNNTMDRIANLLTWMKAMPTTYPTRTELEETVTGLGMRLLDSRPLWGKTPFNMHFLVFGKV